MTTESPEAITPQIVNGSRQLAIEIKAQRELALSNPRDEAKVFAASLAELAIAPEFAEEAYYSIPYNEGTEKETLVEGISVKASRAIARRWSNCAVASRIASETDDSVEVEGVFADFETNTFFRRMVRASKTYIPRGTSIPRPLAGLHLTNAIQAALSKAERNATLTGLPEWFKERYFAKAKAIAGQKGKKEGQTDEQRLAACFGGFAKFKVPAERVAAYVAEKLAGKPTDEIIGTMIGVFNALRDKQTTVDDVFPEAKKAEKPGAVKLGDIHGVDL